ncbi:hypothetical protein MUP95_08195 [bacterium]|nr:hypothetical protein [bacterium]
MLVFLPFFIVLSGWFLWTTFIQGAAGAIETPSIFNVLFSFYEFLGFLGLGPPRNVLRSAPSLHTLFQSSYLISLIGGIACWLIILIFIAINIRRDGIPAAFSPMFIMFCVGIVAFTPIAYLFDFRFWGKHISFLFPLILFILMSLLVGYNRKYRGLNLNLIAIFLLASIWLVSSLRLVSNDYAKDDYRGAVSNVTAGIKNGGTIIWAADIFAANYYGLSLINEPLPKSIWPTKYFAIRAVHWNETQSLYAIRSYVRPIIVAISKSDLFDKNMTLENTLVMNGARLISKPSTFRIYFIP